jgi:hypothetical protein
MNPNPKQTFDARTLFDVNQLAFDMNFAHAG